MSDSPKNKAFGSFKNALGIGLPLMFYDIEGKALDNFSEHECMSKYLTEWKKSRNLESIISPREGVWEITAVFVSKRKIGVKLRLVVEYDLSKNGFVTNAKYYYTWPNKPEFLAKEIIVDTIQDSEGNWWATSLRKIDKLAQSETILFQYKDVKLLQSVSSDMFQIDFPNGTMVSDMLNKMEYKVGDLVDHDKAIENFIRKHNLNNNFPSKTWYWGNMVRYILMILGIILIMAGIIVHFMKRGKQK
jgi:hypothetical protein